MKKIYKYQLEVVGYQKVKMPVRSEIICLQVQHNKPTVWALIGEGGPVRDRQFMMIGTGHSFDPENFEYVGTIQLNSFVWHFYTKI